MPYRDHHHNVYVILLDDAVALHPSRQPTKIERQVVKPTKVVDQGRASTFHELQEIFGGGFQNGLVPDWVEGLALERAKTALLR